MYLKILYEFIISFVEFILLYYTINFEIYELNKKINQ